jgi:chemotaxis protein histidine kinase CheA
MDARPQPIAQSVTFLGDHAVIAPSVALRGKAAVRISAADRTDRDRLERAERAVVALSRCFPNWMADELAKLSVSCVRYAKAQNSDRGDAHQSLSRCAHDLRGNAHQFGYPVAARVAERLCALLGNTRIDTVPEVILQGHMDAIRSILRFGPGQDPTAIEIAEALEELVEKRKLTLLKPENLPRA